MDINWAEQFVGLSLNGMPKSVLALIPKHLQKQWLQRIGDYNPFKTISANHDLVRATRLSWIEAAQEVVRATKHAAPRDQRSRINKFASILNKVLLTTRDLALDRRQDPGFSPMDADIDAVINGVPELVAPGDHTRIGSDVTDRFTFVLHELTGWPLKDIPPLFGEVASYGIPPVGGGAPRPFGELVFAAFAELMKDTTKYPEAEKAFGIAMHKLSKDIAEQTLAAVKGLDAKFDAVLAGVDPAMVLRDGIFRHLELLPSIADGVAETRSRVDEILRIVSSQKGVPIQMLEAVVSGVTETARLVSPEALQKLMTAKGEDAKTLASEFDAAPAPGGNSEVARLRHLASEAVKAGDFAQADAHLAAAEAADLGTGAIEVLPASRRVSAAATRAERAAVAMLVSTEESYDQARDHFRQAAAIVGTTDVERSRSYLIHMARTIVETGRLFGDRRRIFEGISLFRSFLSKIDRRSATRLWSNIHRNLGEALWTLADQNQSAAPMRDAVASFKEALRDLSERETPLEWAATQHSLAIAIEGVARFEEGTWLLLDSPTAARAALRVYARERHPEKWAAVQTHLGFVLTLIGDRESNGIKRYTEAVAVLRAALEERPFERSPADWAETQAHLATAIARLGAGQKSLLHVEEAIAIFREVLKVLISPGASRLGALTENNLGVALIAASRLDPAPARLQEAVDRLDRAAAARPRNVMPLYWAESRFAAGEAYILLGEMQRDRELLQSGVDGFADALEVWSRERFKTRHDAVKALHVKYVAVVAGMPDYERLNIPVPELRTGMKDPTRF